MPKPELPEFVEHLGDGIHAIDTGFHRPRFDAAYLMVDEGRAVFIDTGTNFSVPRLLQALEAVGLEPGDVDHVIATHVHLDHAGGVGLLMQQLPGASLIVQERGARHMIDPTALVLGATAVYGADVMEGTYGRLVPVPAHRVTPTHDNMTIAWQSRTLRFIDTPGHARHHHCIWDSRSRGWFTGDTFGLSYRVFDTAAGAWVIPTTTPVQFEPEPLKHSIGRLIEADPNCMFLTHYSRVDQPTVHARRLLRLIDRMVEIGLQHAELDASRRHATYCQELRALYFEDLRSHGWSAEGLEDGTAEGWLGLDIELNAQGLGIWVDKRIAAGQTGNSARA